MKLLKRIGAFTLVELMVSLAILAVLAAVALVSYSKWVKSAHSSEAVAFIMEIAGKQKSYYGLYQQYVSTGDDYYPATADIQGKQATWDIVCDPLPEDDSMKLAWCQLGAKPDGKTFYQYRTIGWRPDNPPPIPSGKGIASDQTWFYIEARGDLDGNGVFSTFEFASGWTQVKVSDETE